MPIAMHDTTAVLSGDCAIEETDALLEWLRRTDRPVVDLAGCAHLHAALLQTLLALRPAMAAPPRDAFLNRLLAGLPLAADTP